MGVCVRGGGGGGETVFTTATFGSRTLDLKQKSGLGLDSHTLNKYTPRPCKEVHWLYNSQAVLWIGDA